MMSLHRVLVGEPLYTARMSRRRPTFPGRFKTYIDYTKANAEEDSYTDTVLEEDVIGGSSLDYNKHYHSMRYIPERTHGIQASDPYHTELPHTYWKHYNISNFQDDTRPRTQNRIIHIVDEKVQNVRKSFRNMDSRLKDLRQSYRRGDVDLKYLRKSFRNLKLSRNVSFSRNDQYYRSFRFMRDIVSRGYRQNCYLDKSPYMMKYDPVHTTHTYPQFKVPGWVHIILGLLLIIMGIVDAVYTSSEYEPEKCSYSGSAFVPGPCEADHIYTYVVSPIWGGVLMVMTGVITFYLTAKKMRYNNWLLQLYCGLNIFFILIICPAIITLNVLELVQNEGTFWKNDDGIEFTDEIKFAFPIVIIILAVLEWVVSILALLVCMCCLPKDLKTGKGEFPYPRPWKQEKYQEYLNQRKYINPYHNQPIIIKEERLPITKEAPPSPVHIQPLDNCPKHGECTCPKNNHECAQCVARGHPLAQPQANLLPQPTAHSLAQPEAHSLAQPPPPVILHGPPVIMPPTPFNIREPSYPPPGESREEVVYEERLRPGDRDYDQYSRAVQYGERPFSMDNNRNNNGGYNSDRVWTGNTSRYYGGGTLPRDGGNLPHGGGILPYHGGGIQSLRRGGGNLPRGGGGGSGILLPYRGDDIYSVHSDRSLNSRRTTNFEWSENPRSRRGRY